MKIFDITNSRHQEILAEEIARAKKILLREGYNEDVIWDSMSPDERWEAIASVRDDEGPDDADKFSEKRWDEIPDDLTDRIDLSVYQLSTNDIGGRTNLRAIKNFLKKNPATQKVVDAFLKKVKRKSVDALTVKQSYQLLTAVHKVQPGNSGEIDRTGTTYNPYDAPGGHPSRRGPLGGKWTGD